MCRHGWNYCRKIFQAWPYQVTWPACKLSISNILLHRANETSVRKLWYVQWKDLFYSCLQLFERFVDSYQHLIQPLETGTGLTFRSSRVRDEVSKRSHRNRQFNLHTNINDTFTLNATVTMISQVTASMPDAGKAKEHTAMAPVMVTDG